jgi:hypothetical protein
VLAALRAENQAHHWCRRDDPRAVRARARLREVFCPASPSWRAQAVSMAIDVIEQAVRGLGVQEPA